MCPQIEATEVLSVKVLDRDMLGDEDMGRMEFDLGAALRELPLSCRDATWQQAFPLQKVILYPIPSSFCSMS